jgi:hypothetical protein
MFYHGLCPAVFAAARVCRFPIIFHISSKICSSIRRFVSRWKVYLPWFQLLEPKAPLPQPACLTRRQENQYWLESDLYGRQLRSSDARFCGLQFEGVMPSSLLTYYVPRLLPVYRTPTESDIDETTYHLSAKQFCKWHHMVFSGPVGSISSQFRCSLKQLLRSCIRH